MPIYEYQCDDCSHQAEEYQSIRSAPVAVCPVCTSPTYHRVPSIPHSLDKPFHKPIEMYSIALDQPEEIRAFKQRNSGIKMSDNPRDPLYGVPIAHSRAEKLRILKKEGFVEKN